VDAAAREVVAVPAGDAGPNRSLSGGFAGLGAVNARLVSDPWSPRRMIVVGPSRCALSGHPPLRSPVPDSMHTAGRRHSAPN
jgi:hypothetical protein